MPPKNYADSVSHNSGKARDTNKIVGSGPMMLCSLAREDIEVFLRAYDFYAKAKKVEDMEPMPLLDCLDERLTEMLGVREPNAVKSDKTLREFLESKRSFNDPAELLAEFDKLHMDPATKDEELRLAEFETQFLHLKKRQSGFELSDDVLMNKFCSGLWPLSVQKSVESLLQTNDCDLTTLMDAAARCVKEQNKWYRAERASGGKSSRELTSFTPAKSKATWSSKVPTSSASQTSASQSSATSNNYSTHNHHNNDQKSREQSGTEKHYYPCRRCGGEWRPGHRCQPKKVNALNAKKVDTPINTTVTSLPNHVSVVVGGGVHVSAMVDTGANVSVMTKGLAEELARQSEVTFIPRNGSVTLANGARIPVTRHVRVSLCMASPTGVGANLALTWVFWELDSMDKRLILGTDIFTELGLVKEGELRIPWNPASANHDDSTVPEVAFNLYSILGDEGIHTDDTHTAVVHVSHDVLSSIKYGDNEAGKKAKSLIESKYRDRFSMSVSEQPSKLVPFKIELTKDEIIHLKARPIRKEKIEKVKEELDNLEKLGVIRKMSVEEESRCFWLPMIAVDKADGKVRIVEDTTESNKITKPFIYTMPLIKDILRSAAGSTFKAKFDTTNGYHQCAMEESSIRFTGLTTPFGKYVYLREPQGPMNGVTHFQFAMETAFCGLVSKIMWIYVDDILIVGNTVDEFITNLTAVLDRCVEYNIILKPTKAVVGVEELEMTGHVLTRDGIKMSAERTRVVKELLPPRDKTELMIFLGKVNYFKDFMSGAQNYTAVMTELLHKGKDYVWQDKHQIAFEKLKDMLSSDTVLAQDLDDGNLILRSDASDQGAGGVLILEKGGIERPVCFYGHVFSEAQKHWTTYEKELFAIIFCLTRPITASYIKSKKIRVETDHRNLVYLVTSAKSNQKIWRWMTLLCEYNFELFHIAGANNVVADAVSRLVRCPVDDPIVHSITDAINQETEIKLLDDKFIDELKDEQNNQSEAWKKSFVYDSVNGLFKDNNGCAVVPEQSVQRLRVIKSVHGNAITGHKGRDQTVKMIEESGYTWNTIRADVSDYIKLCAVCQKMRLRQRVNVELHTTMVDSLWYAVATDSIGPFKEDRETKCRYITVFIDAFSRQVELCALKTVDARSTADALMSCWFLRHGIPKQVLSDNGSQFANALIDELLQILKVQHKTTLPYHPQGNGVTERVNREILKHLLCLTVNFGKRDDWVSTLPFIQNIINNSIHSTTGFTPNQLVYGDHFSANWNLPSALTNARVITDAVAEEIRSEEGKKRLEMYISELRLKDKETI